MKNLSIIAGSSNTALGTRIAQHLSTPLTPWTKKVFSDGEFWVSVDQNLTDKHVAIIQSGYFPQHDYIFELLLLIDAARRQGAKRIHLVFPFLPYRRQERQSVDGEAVSASVIGRIFSQEAIESVTVCNEHTSKTADFFTTPSYYNLEFWDVYSKSIMDLKQNTQNLIAVAPDAGSIQDTTELAQRLDVDVVTCEKFRPSHDTVAIKNVSGDVKGKSIVMVDDEVNTGGTVAAVSDELIKLGAQDITLVATHGVLSGNAQTTLLNSGLSNIILSDTIPLQHLDTPFEKKLTIASVAEPIATHIKQLITSS